MTALLLKTEKTENQVVNNPYKESTLVNKHSENVKAEISDTILGSNVINFIIVLIFIAWVIKKANLAALIVKKQNEIIELVKNAEDEKRIKRNHFNDTRIKVANVNQEVTKILSEGEQVSKNLAENIREDANKQSEDMQKKAAASLENDKLVVSSELTSIISGAAFNIAENHIKKAIDERLHKKYIEEFVNSLDEIHN